MKLNLLVHSIQKIWMMPFWTMVHRWEKWGQSWKAYPGGRAKIENGVWYDFDIFNFGSATRGYFSDVSALFTSMDIMSKTGHSDYLKDMILIGISNEMYKKCLFWASCIASILNTTFCGMLCQVRSKIFSQTAGKLFEPYHHSYVMYNKRETETSNVTILA